MNEKTWAVCHWALFAYAISRKTVGGCGVYLISPTSTTYPVGVGLSKRECFPVFFPGKFLDCYVFILAYYEEYKAKNTRRHYRSTEDDPFASDRDKKEDSCHGR